MLATPQDKRVALETRGLSKQFSGVAALSDVSFALESGEIHALVGQNGAGKSTLVNILSGMLSADAGEVRVGGRPTPIGNPRRAIELGIVTVYQELSLLPNLTVAQNVALGREPRRRGLLDLAAMRDAAGRALDRIGVDIDPGRRVGTLTLAERQLVEVAKALSYEPSTLILDEPTAPLAAREAERLFGIMHALRAQGIAIVFVSHRFREILDHCDRATILRNGRKIMTTALAGLDEAGLTDAMIGETSARYARPQRSTSGDVLLEAHGLAWGAKVKAADVRVVAGEIVAITGLLGAGQNEIARLLGGDLVPEAGSIAVRGQPVRPRTPADAIAAGVCLLTDDRKHEGILPNRSLAANMALPSLAQRQRLGFVDGAAERRAVGERMRRFGVVARSAAQPIRTLSGGNQQKALIARWDLNDSAVFVLIEPTRGVDVGARADIYRRLAALAAAGKGIVIVSSDIQEVLAVADRILVVREGRVAAQALPAQQSEETLNLLVQGAA